MITNYEPPLSPEGEMLPLASRIGELWPGVMGYAVESKLNGRIYIPLIVAKNEGAGDVGEFLDALSWRCSISNVTSARLRGMLKRRGFKRVMENSPVGPFDRWDAPRRETHA